MHDQFIRAILSDKSIAADYFLAYLPPAISQHLDFATLVHLPDIYLSKELQESLSDIVYQCRKKGGKETVKVSLLVEHKSYPDKYTPIQIGSYIFSALQKQVVNKEPLSIIIPVLLYHGQGKWRYRTLAQLFNNLEPEWQQYLPDFSYVYNNLGEVEDAAVEQLNNQFLAASLLALKHAFEKEWLGQNALRILLLSGSGPEQLQSQLVIYLFGRSELRAAEVSKLFDSLSLDYKNKFMSTLDYLKEEAKKEGKREGIQEGIREGIREGKQEGKQEGIQEGKQEGKQEGIREGIERGEERKSIEFVSNLLLSTTFSVAEIARLANVAEAFVLKVKSTIQQQGQ